MKNPDWLSDISDYLEIVCTSTGWYMIIYTIWIYVSNVSKDVESPCFDRVHAPTSWVCASHGQVDHPFIIKFVRSFRNESCPESWYWENENPKRSVVVQSYSTSQPSRIIENTYHIHVLNWFNTSLRTWIYIYTIYNYNDNNNNNNNHHHHHQYKIYNNIYI